MTDSETHVWIVKFYGCMNGDQSPDKDHVVVVLADDPEEAIKMIRVYHDSAAVIEYIHKKWVLQIEEYPVSR